MTLSATELGSLAERAARGAGAPPAQASEFGRAALCHLIAGRDPALLGAALTALPRGPILEIPLALTQVVETAVEGRAAGPLRGTADPDLLCSYAEAQPFATRLVDGAGAMTVEIDLTTPRTRASVHRVTLPADLRDRMSDLAARLLVPETEASRLSGAGAGLTDND